MPAAIAASIPKLGETTGQSDPVMHLKWFTPDSNWTWWIAEFCPDSQICYGLVHGFEREWGTFFLAEIRELRGGLGLPVERDLHFTPVPASQLNR